MVTPHVEPNFQTTDTPLAAYLYSEGFELLEVDTSNFPSVFYFRNDNPKLREFVHSFQVGRAEGNIVVFYRAYRKMIAHIRRGV